MLAVVSRCKQPLGRSAVAGLIVAGLAILALPTFRASQAAAPGESSQPLSGTSVLGANSQDAIAQPRTIHWKYAVSVTSGGPDTTKDWSYSRERWLDLKTGRYCEHFREEKGGEETQTYEKIFDGEYVTYIDPQRREVTFVSRTSPLQGEVERRLHEGVELRRQYLGDPANLPHMAQTGQEQLRGVAYDVWEGTVSIPFSGTTPRSHVRAWLAPKTGELGRLEARAERPSEVSTETYEVIDRNQPIPAERLAVKLPEGYTFANTRETARPVKFYCGRHAEFGTDDLGGPVSFSLPDGSVLAAWSYRGSQMNLQKEFSDTLATLKVGRPLPSSALMMLGAIRTDGLKEEVEFVGRFLTYTEDEQGRWAWCIYVPRGKPPERSSFRGYLVPYLTGRTTQSGIVTQQTWSAQEAHGDLPIADAKEFDLLVVGAMKEYATEQPGRSLPTYDEVMQLTRKTRESLDE